MPAALTADSMSRIREDIYSTTWPYMRVWKLPDSKRAKLLRCCMAFVEGTQHDHYSSDFDGRPRDPGVGYLQERMNPQGFVRTGSGVVNIGDRKPNASYPLPRQATMQFTAMLVGEGLQPTVSTSDPFTDEYLHTILAESKTWNSLQQARDHAGGCGSSAVLLSVEDGKPCSEALDTADLWVVEWKPGPDWIPALVIEQRLVEEQHLDPESGEMKDVRVWKTRAWDEEYSYTFEDVPEDHGKDAEGKHREQGPRMLRGLTTDDEHPYRAELVGNDDEGEDDYDEGEIKIAYDDDGEPMVFEHKMGRCPVHWMQSTRNTKAPEGRPDSEGGWHLADRIDRLQSMVVRASISNVDPTLVYSDDERRQRNNPFLKKGWGQVIRTGPQGKAAFLETTGESIKMGWDGVHELRDEYQATVGCMIVDPKTAGQYKSGEALQMLWRAMEPTLGRKRTPVGDTIEQLCRTWIHVGLSHGVANGDDPESKGGIVLPPIKRKEEQEAKPPEPPKPGEPPKPPEPTPEPKETWEAYQVGKGRHVMLTWPPYHAPTASQLLAFAQALGIATGQKPVVSQQSAVEAMTNFLGRGDAGEEYERIKEEKEANVAQFGAAMFGGGADEGSSDDEKREDAKDAEANADREAARGTEKKGGDAGSGGGGG